MGKGRGNKMSEIYIFTKAILAVACMVEALSNVLMEKGVIKQKELKALYKKIKKTPQLVDLLNKMEEYDL